MLRIWSNAINVKPQFWSHILLLQQRNCPLGEVERPVFKVAGSATHPVALALDLGTGNVR
jgi:hypothetical protein